jgi:hypothetical protein
MSIVEPSLLSGVSYPGRPVRIIIAEHPDK